MKAPSSFIDFLSNIRPTDSQTNRMRESHLDLRKKLEDDTELAKILVGTFVQGSYRRHTGIKATSGYECDVDIVVVTNLDKTAFNAAHALGVFKPFLDKFYPKKHYAQDRSWFISVNEEVKMDLVPTSEPGVLIRKMIENRVLDSGAFLSDIESGGNIGSKKQMRQLILEAAEAESEWEADDPLWIPDRKRMDWDRTHPIYQIKWTASKNKRCEGHFVNVVKAIKWWKRHQAPTPKYPKGFPLEHLVGDCCPDGIGSVAEGVALTMEEMVKRYRVDAEARRSPIIPDRSLPENNVFQRIDGTDFAEFYSSVESTAMNARSALDDQDLASSTKKWRGIFGDEFPISGGGGGNGGDDGNGGPSGFTPRTNRSEPAPTGRFALLA